MCIQPNYLWVIPDLSLWGYTGGAALMTAIDLLQSCDYSTSEALSVYTNSLFKLTGGRLLN